jgi:hypothetical protein
VKDKLANLYTYTKTKLFTASIFFTLAVVLVGGITLIELPCPVCDGTGYIRGAKGVEVIDIERKLVSHEVVGLECGWDFERYEYDIKLVVENTTINPTYGLVEITFHDPESTKVRYIEVDDEVEEAVETLGGVIAAATIFVEELAAGDTRTIEDNIIFDGITLEQLGVEIHEIQASTAAEFPCPFHDEGTNKVPFTTWLRLR